MQYLNKDLSDRKLVLRNLRYQRDNLDSRLDDLQKQKAQLRLKLIEEGLGKLEIIRDQGMKSLDKDIQGATSLLRGIVQDIEELAGQGL